MISVEAILVTLCQLWKWFSMLRELWKPASRKTYQNLRNLQGKHMWRSFVIVKPFFLQFCSNFTHDSEFYDLMSLWGSWFWNFSWDLGLFSSLPGLPDPNSKGLTIMTLLLVQCGYRKTVYIWYQIPKV